MTSTRTCSNNVVPSLFFLALPSFLPPFLPLGGREKMRGKSKEGGENRPLAPKPQGTPLARPNCAAAFSKRPEALAGELNSPSSSPEFASEPSDGSSSEGFPRRHLGQVPLPASVVPPAIRREFCWRRIREIAASQRSHCCPEA